MSLAMQRSAMGRKKRGTQSFSTHAGFMTATMRI
jgi:hypothetical protein